MASSSNMEGDSQHPTSKEEKKKKTRGITRMKQIAKARKSGIKFSVGWNSKGQPIDPNKSKFMHFIGHVTRNRVPISIFKWKEVSKQLKKDIWDEVMQCFEVHEDHKDLVLSSAGSKFRAFRTRLRKHIKEKAKEGILDPPPPKKYDRLDTVTRHWKEFVTKSSTEKFNEESKANAQRATGIPHRYRKSAKGYAQLEQDLLASSGSCMTYIPRHMLWKEARLNKQGNIDKEETQRVVDECEIISQSIPQEELQSLGKDDVLARALGVPEHPGRVRAAGFGATQRTVFRQSQSTPYPSFFQWSQMCQQVQQLTHIVLSMSGKDGVPPFMSGIPPFMTQQGQQPYVMPNQPPFMSASTQTVPQMPIHSQSHPNNQRGNCTPIDFEIPEGDHPCMLYLSPPYRLVGKGMVFNTVDGKTLHGRSLPLHHHKVSIQTVERGQEDSKLPVPDEDENLIFLREAIGAFIAWPSSLIYLPQQVPSSKGKGKETGQTKESITSPVKKGLDSALDFKEFVGSQGVYCFKILKLHVKADEPILVADIPMSICHWGKAFTDKVGIENIAEIIHHKRLSASTLCLYIRYLCEIYLCNTDMASRFSFISPFELEENFNPTPHGHICEMLLRHEGHDHLFIVPYNVGDHWVLIAINTSHEKLYYMDPLRYKLIKRPNMQALFHNAIVTYRANRVVRRTKMNQSFEWVTVQCPKQTNGIDCGYYVGLFIRDILHHGHTTIPNNYFSVSRTPFFPDTKIEQFQREWCAYIYHRFIKDDLSRISN